MRKINEQTYNNPLFSIITVVYNGEETIENTIKSVIAQEYKNFEFIIIDGSSTDNTKGIIDKYRNHISIYLNEPDNGIYDAMNKAIPLANGRYIHFLNSGDRFYNKSVLEKVAEILEKKSPSLLIGGTIHQDLIDNLEFYNSYKIKSFNSFYRKGNMICHQAIFHHIKTFKDHGVYSLDYKIVADHDWLLRFLLNKSLKETVCYIDTPIVYYDMRGVSANNRMQVINERIKIIKNNRSSFFSFYYALMILYIDKSKIYGIRLLQKMEMHETYRRIKYSLLSKLNKPKII